MKNNMIEWQPIQIDSLFQEFVRGKISSVADETKDSNGIPYVGATTRNNGVLDFLVLDKDKKQRGNCIVFIRDGQGSVGLSVYRSTPFVATVNTSSAYSNWLNKYNGIFVSVSSNQVRVKYSFGYKRKEERLLSEKIMLPVNKNGQPDYNYMTKFLKEKQDDLLSKYIIFCKKQINEIYFRSIPKLEEKRWLPFLLSGVFSTIKRGKRLKKANHIAGQIPYVSSTASNNGVDNYIVASSGTRVFNDCISLANSGSVGVAFYEPFSFVASDHITSLKRENSSKFIYLFLITTIQKQKSNFNFNREINDNRIKKMQIMLPVTENEQPDFEYMEQYAKNMMLKKYKQYLSFLERKERR